MKDGIPEDDKYFERAKSEVVVYLAGCAESPHSMSRVSFTAAMVDEEPEDYLRL